MITEEEIRDKVIKDQQKIINSRKCYSCGKSFNAAIVYDTCEPCEIYYGENHED